MARPKKISEITEEMLGVNPFVDKLVIPVRRRRREDVENGGTKFEYIESTHYLKLYDHAGYKNDMKNLSIRGKEMWLYVIHYLPYGKDWMFIDAVKYMADMKIKAKNTFLEAIKELDRNGFIKLDPFIKYAFFINPNKIFKGSRVNKYPNNLDVKKWQPKKDSDGV